MTFDIGQNLTFLGIAFLALKYLLPLVIGLFLIALGIWLFRRFTAANNDLLSMANNSHWLIVIVCAVLILAIVLLI